MITHDPALAHTIIVNTCGFISTALDEAVETILDMARYKTDGACQRLIATGCLSQRYKDDPELVNSLPEVDAFLGTAACDHIVAAVNGKDTQSLTLFPDPNSRGFQNPTESRELLSTGFAYIKVSEGCNRHCTYCIIPSLRGKQRSRPVQEICNEAVDLVKGGVTEIILTAENTTDYGQDFNTGEGLHTVLEHLSPAVKNVNPNAWIRFLYTHPSTLDDWVIKAVRDHDNICSYYDVPIQHAASSTLKRMGRPYTQHELTDLFERIRRIDPEACLRTTVIVGFPGETEAEFQILLNFIKEIEFDHLGVFSYSDSDDLKSHSLKNHIPEEVAEQRHDMIMAAQAAISKAHNLTHVGNTYPVRIEEMPEEGVYIGRTPFQAPDVDGVTFIYSEGLDTGAMVQVKVTDAYEYDIAGEKA